MRARIFLLIIGLLSIPIITNAQPAPPGGVGIGTPPQRYQLTITKTGNGLGTVTGSGITCGPDCTQYYNSGVNVTITATPLTNFVFAGWSGGGCTGIGNCVVNMTQARAVTASFTYTLRMSWNDNATDETSQIIERRSPCGSGTFALAGSVAADITTFTDTNIQAGNSYEYRVAASNSGGTTYGTSPTTICSP